MCRRPRAPAVLLLAWGLLAGPAAEASARPGEILVRLRAEGAHAVIDCAEARQRRGEPLAGAARDGSPSLDLLHAELGVRRVRALFRRSDGRPFAEQRRRLRERFQRRRPAPAGPSAMQPAGRAPDLAHVYRLELEAGMDPRSAAARYAADPHVVWAQPNFDTVLDVLGR